MPNPLLDQLNTKTVVIGLTVTRPRFTYKVESGKIIVGDDADATDLTTGTQWRVIPDDKAKSLAKVERKARDLIMKNGVVLTKGIYVVPVTRIQQMFADFDAIKAEYATAAQQLSYDWDEIVEAFFQRIKDKCNGSSAPIIEELRKRIPKGDSKFIARFDMSIMHWPFGNDGMLGEKAAEQLSQDVVAMMNNSARRLVEQTMVSLFEVPRNELLASIESVSRAVEEGRAVRETSMDLLKRSYAKLQDFAFMIPEEVQAKLAELGNNINQFGGTTISDAQARATLVGHLAEVQQNLDRIDQIESIPLSHARPITMDF